MKEFTVTAIGEDRPGIVAAVTEILLHLGCNLADCSMSLLRGQFAMLLLIEAPEEMDPERLEAALSEPAGRLSLSIATRRVAAQGPPAAGRPYVVSFYGNDRPGIVHRISKALAEAEVNICNLASHLVGDGIYFVVLDIDAPAGVEPAELEAGLKEIASELGISLTLRSGEGTLL
ncbi:MAG: glycine cleavage system protein R [Actinomycetota bacterium]